MGKVTKLDELWAATPRAEQRWSGAPTSLCEPARRYLDHALSVEAPLARAVRLVMRGEIKLGKWCPFHAEQVIQRERGMIWAATVRLFGLPIRGSDSIVDGAGAMRWKLFGFIPIVNDSGPDVTRSAAGRLAAELVWLPSALTVPDVRWEIADPGARARFEQNGEDIDLRLGIADDGRLRSLSLRRWGNPPESAKHDYFDFGGLVEEEGTFDGYTIPTRLRIGWYAGSDRFESEGEFIRVSLESAEFR